HAAFDGLRPPGRMLRTPGDLLFSPGTELGRAVGVLEEPEPGADAPPRLGDVDQRLAGLVAREDVCVPDPARELAQHRLCGRREGHRVGPACFRVLEADLAPLKVDIAPPEP